MHHCNPEGYFQPRCGRGVTDNETSRWRNFFFSEYLKSAREARREADSSIQTQCFLKIPLRSYKLFILFRISLRSHSISGVSELVDRLASPIRLCSSTSQSIEACVCQQHCPCLRIWSIYLRKCLNLLIFWLSDRGTSPGNPISPLISIRTPRITLELL